MPDAPDAPVTSRARIGLIIPSVNRLTEIHFHRYAPEGVEIHVTRVRITRSGTFDLIPLAEQLPAIVEGARLLAEASCDVIVYHCTGSSMEAGLGAERQAVEEIAQATGRPAATTATAVQEALRALHAQRLVLVTPYDRKINDAEIAFLGEAGLEVLRDRALHLDADGMVTTPPSVWLETTLEAADPRADAYFLSCTNIRSPDVVDALEARLGKPVVTSNQATLWYCLRTCGLDDRVPGLGRLLELGRLAGVPT
jgi:maleate isomerase